jgi:hypothetical protein
MAIYLKKFETQAAYEAAESSLILPNVSLTVDNNTVHYNPISPTPPTPTYESVDLGLPSGTKWAKCNVGADTETEYGLYYKFASGIYDGYNNEFYGESGTDGTTMSPSLDSAKCIMGGDWHTPTKTQCEELLSNTTQQWTSINGVNGCKFTSSNGNYIFIPASGHIFSGSLSADGTEARVWTSTIKYSSDSAYVLSLENGSYSVTSNWQYISYTVRGVKDN